MSFLPRARKSEARIALVVVVGLMITGLVGGGILFSTYIMPFVTARPFSSIGPNGQPIPSLLVNNQASGVTSGGTLSISVSGVTPGGNIKIVESSAPIGTTSTTGTTSGATNTTSGATNTSVNTGLTASLTVFTVQGNSGSQSPIGYVPVYVDNTKVGATDYTGKLQVPITTGNHVVSCGPVSGLVGPTPATFSGFITGDTTDTCSYSVAAPSGSATLSVQVTIGGFPMGGNYQVLLFTSAGTQVSAASSNCIVDSNGACVTNAQGIVTFQSVAPNTEYTVCNAGTSYLSGKCGAFTATVTSGPVGTVTPVTLATTVAYSAFTSQGLIISSGGATSSGTYTSTFTAPNPVGTTFYLTALDVSTGQYSNSVDVTVGQSTDSCSLIQNGQNDYVTQFNCGVERLTGLDPATLPMTTKFALGGIILAVVMLLGYLAVSSGRGNRQGYPQQPMVYVVK